VKQLFSVCVLKQVCIFKRFLFIYSPVNSFKFKEIPECGSVVENAWPAPGTGFQQYKKKKRKRK
jgi:hypothetical protein